MEGKDDTSIHYWNPSFMQPVHNLSGRYPDSADKQSRLFLDDYINELGKLTVGVIVLGRRINSDGKSRVLQWYGADICFACISPNLGNQEVDTKGCILIFEILLDSLDLRSVSSRRIGLQIDVKLTC